MEKDADELVMQPLMDKLLPMRAITEVDSTYSGGSRPGSVSVSFNEHRSRPNSIITGTLGALHETGEGLRTHSSAESQSPGSRKAREHNDAVHQCAGQLTHPEEGMQAPAPAHEHPNKTELLHSARLQPQRGEGEIEAHERHVV